MDFEKEFHNDVLIERVNLTRATFKEAEEFKSQLVMDIQEGWQKIVVDLSECEFIDSTFLGALVVTLKKVTAAGGDIRLIGFHSAVNSMFELTRMYRVFDSFRSREEAIESYS
jgi:anti-anti-sigma factor